MKEAKERQRETRIKISVLVKVTIYLKWIINFFCVSFSNVQKEKERWMEKKEVTTTRLLQGFTMYNVYVVRNVWYIYLFIHARFMYIHVYKVPMLGCNKTKYVHMHEDGYKRIRRTKK